jgi:hypothetical protein
MVDETPNALSRKVELIRALAEDLAIEIRASYTDEDFAGTCGGGVVVRVLEM